MLSLDYSRGLYEKIVCELQPLIEEASNHNSWSKSESLLALLWARSLLSLPSSSGTLSDVTTMFGRMGWRNKPLDVIQNMRGNTPEVGMAIIVIASNNLAGLGLYSRATYGYLSILTYWLGVLEINLNPANSGCDDPNVARMLVELNSEMEAFFTLVLETLRTGEGGAFKAIREENGRWDDYDALRKSATTGVDGKVVEEISFWFRSPIENQLMMFFLWELYARHKLKNVIDGTAYSLSTGLARMLPGSSKAKAIYRWLITRARVDRTLAKLPNATFDDDYYSSVARTLVLGYQAGFDTQNLMPGGETNSIPPRSLVLTTVWDLLYGLIETKSKAIQSKDIEDSEKRRNMLSVVAEVEEALSHYLEIQGVPRRFGNLLYLANRCEKAMMEQANMLNENSNAYKNGVRDRYFLFDDFEDPAFLTDRTVLSMLTSDARKRIHYITTNMEVFRLNSSAEIDVYPTS